MPSIWDEIIAQTESQDGEKLEICGIKEGVPCPNCKFADLEYNGLLSLVCPNCGVEYSGSFT